MGSGGQQNITLQEVLEKTASPNPDDQKLAYDFLKKAYENNFVEFVKLLSELLRSAEVSDVVRQSAGLTLKNSLTAKEEEHKKERVEKWTLTPAQIRDYVKENVIETLGSEKFKPSQAAQCVACIACIELPMGEWKTSIQRLMQNVTGPNSSEALKEASLEALGYICQDIQSMVLMEQSNAILTAIVNGMKRDEPSDRVRLAATTALYNSLEFTSANFANESERHLIMQVVCETSQSMDTKVKVAALQCLVRIMSLYYEYMEHYMGPALFAITLDAMKSPVDDVCLQGIEFWSNVCEEEIDLSVEAEEALSEGRPPEHTSKFYAKGALSHLVPILTAALAKQEEGDDDDEWNPAKASGVSLMLLAQCVGDDVVVAVLPFVTENINHANWRLRDAAIMAFGSVLEGPDPEKLKTLVQQALPMLINLMTDSNTSVRDTAAWCIGRVCDATPGVVVQPEVLTPLLPALSQSLMHEARVATNVCWAISSLAAAAYEEATKMEATTDDTGQPETFILTSCFDAMISELLKVTDRPDAHQSNLRIAAYEALMELIKNSPKDCYMTVQKTMVIILNKMDHLFAMESQIQSSSDKSQFRDLQSLLCATLQSVLRKMRKEDAPLISDPVMQALTRIVEHSSGKDGGGVVEEALMAVSTLVEVLEDKFLKYMPGFKPYLLGGLKNHEEYQVCLAAVGLVGDLARALQLQLMEYLNEIMELLVQILQNEKVDKSVKPQILSTFGDVALAIGPHFTTYSQVVFQLLITVSQAELKDKDDYDQLEYFNQLRESCLEAYTGIIQGFQSGNDPAQKQELLKVLQPYVANMLVFLEKISVETHPSDTLLANAAGLIGDLVGAYGRDILPKLETDMITNLLTKGRRAKAQKTRTLANWASKEVRKLKNPGS